MTEKHSPLPWTSSEEDFLDDMKLTDLFDAKGLHIASHLSPEDAEHILACVNGTDARTVALIEALEGTRRFVPITTGHGPEERETDISRKIRAALALARKA